MIDNKIQAIILAGGKSTRAKTDKQFFKIKDKYLIEITVSKFLKIKEVSKIILVLSKENIEKYSYLFKNHKITITEGGETRTQSLINGSKFIKDTDSVIMVHDGARPFISENLIKKLYETACRKGNAVPALKLKDTVKEIDENMKVKKTLNRNSLMAVQTPQCYKIELFKKLIENIRDCDFTDDSQIIEKLGYDVFLVEGEEANIKITTPIDFAISEAIYEKGR
jgi:2-C-methyl-D-erythritol 4-phosphate cytidylyltransferase